MIRDRKTLKEYISADKSRYIVRRPTFLGRILNDESYFILRYLKCLRYLEYYKNTHRKSLFYLYYELKYRYFSRKYNISITPNTVGKGLRIPHYNGGIIINCKSMGDWCTVNSGVILGKKKGKLPIIGNHVDISVGAKVIGGIAIGNNVIIGANAVVVTNVPDNTIVGGIPAKIIRYNTEV